MNNTYYNYPNNKNIPNNIPCITDYKKIYIHKPSDFLKNKYTLLGSLANNSELLSVENKRSYHSPRFSMQDINQQINRENQIIGSIIKDETDSLPSLLKNYIPTLISKKKKENYINIHRNSVEKAFDCATPPKDVFNNIMLNKFQNKINLVNNSNNDSGNSFFSKTINCNKKIESLYSTVEPASSNKAAANNNSNNKLVNLHFFISSPESKCSNFASSAGNYGKTCFSSQCYSGFNNCYNYNCNINVNSPKMSCFYAKSQSIKYNPPIKIDNNCYSNDKSIFSIKTKKNNSFKEYLNAKVKINSSKGNYFDF